MKKSTMLLVSGLIIAAGVGFYLFKSAQIKKKYNVIKGKGYEILVQK